MANLAGKIVISGAQKEQGTCIAVDEWATRVAATLPGELTAPRNTLRGHPQPWKTRPVKALEDEGPMHYSVKGPLADEWSRAKFATSRPREFKIPGSNTSTAELNLGEWGVRLNATTANCGTRGSLAPNWKPREQQDLTGTGSVNLAGWAEGTKPFVAPGTTMFSTLVKAANNRVVGATWSTAELSRPEWEGRLDASGVGVVA